MSQKTTKTMDNISNLLNFNLSFWCTPTRHLQTPPIPKGRLLSMHHRQAGVSLPPAVLRGTRWRRVGWEEQGLLTWSRQRGVEDWRILESVHEHGCFQKGGKELWKASLAQFRPVKVCRLHRSTKRENQETPVSGHSIVAQTPFLDHWTRNFSANKISAIVRRYSNFNLHAEKEGHKLGDPCHPCAELRTWDNRPQ